MRNRTTRLSLLGLTAALALTAPAGAQDTRTLRSARQLWDREPHEVRIQYGAGRLELTPTDQPLLYQMELRYNERHFTPLTQYDADSRRLTLGLKGVDGRKGDINVKDESHANISLSRRVPMDLRLEFGAGEAEIDLGGISLQRLAISTGASETTVRFDAPNPVRAERLKFEAGAAELRVINLGNARAERIEFQGGVGSTVLDFGGKWTHSAQASVRMGIGSVVLRIPRNLGVRINKKSFWTSFDAPGLTKRGSDFYSANWDSATHRLDIDIDAALGSIEVEWIG